MEACNNNVLVKALENPTSVHDLAAFSGALCTLGGFVQIDNNSVRSTQGALVVSAPRYHNRIHVVFQSRKDQYVTTAHTSRINAIEGTPTSEIALSFSILMNHSGIFDTLMDIVRCDVANIKDLLTLDVEKHSWIQVLPLDKLKQETEAQAALEAAKTKAEAQAKEETESKDGKEIKESDDSKEDNKENKENKEEKDDGRDETPLLSDVDQEIVVPPLAPTKIVKSVSSSSLAGLSSLSLASNNMTVKPAPKFEDVQYLDCEVLLSELRYRAMSVVESLLSTAEVSEWNMVDQAVSLLIESSLRNNSKRKKLSSANVDNTMIECVLLRDRSWEINNRISPFYVQMPLAPMQTLKISNIDQDLQHLPQPSQSIYSKLPYEQEKLDVTVKQNKMLAYWNKYIIPRVQDLVRGSFTPFEMDEFFLQLRQPLHVGNQFEAMRIAHRLCEYRLPDGVSIPPDDKDWTTCMFEE